MKYTVMQTASVNDITATRTYAPASSPNNEVPVNPFVGITRKETSMLLNRLNRSVKRSSDMQVKVLLLDPLYSGSLSFLFLVFLNHRHEADPGQNNDQDTQYHQIDIPVGDLGQLDAQRILIGKEEVRPEIDVLQFTVKIGR